MLTCIKRCLARGLRALLHEDNPEPVSVTHYLDVLVAGRSGPLLTRYLIVGVIGTRLEGIPVNGGSKGVRLIAETEAVDKEHFQALWKQHAGQKVKLVWEDTMEEVK